MAVRHVGLLIFFICLRVCLSKVFTELHKRICKGRCFGKSKHVLETQHLLECLEVGVTGYWHYNDKIFGEG